MEPVLYDIKDAARYLGVAPSTLRYWEREGLVRAGRNRGNDYRQYALHDLIDASEIAFYRRLGVPVRELAGYRTLSARDLDDALDRTARDVEQRIAELSARLDAADQERLFSHTMPQAFGTGISTVIVAVMLLVFDWRLACASLWPVPVALLILLATSRAQTAKTRGKNAAALALADDIQEYLESNREVRALNRADDFLGRLNDDVDAFERAKLASELVTGTAVVCTQTLLRLGIVTTILVGTALVAAGQCSLLVFFCFMLVVTRLYDPIGLILQSVAELIDMTQSLARMKAIEGEPAQTGELTFNPQGHDIVFDDVTFAYDDGGPVLSSVSFTAREGEVTALVGPSGSGKSTAAKLAARFWDVGEGAVTVGGVDVSGIDPETLLTDYTEVFQDVVLFNGTVMENIRLGRRDATDEEVLAAAGFGGRMGHGLGHGVGIDIHEEPVLAPRNERPLVAGNVVTVEPGIYLPGKFGMRLEDFGVVTDNGFDVFTNSTHDLVVI